MTRAIALTLTLGLGPGVRSLQAQTVDSSAMLAGWQDSLASWSTDSLQHAADRSAKLPLERLRSGWILLSLGTRLGSAKLSARAMDQFYEVAVRRPHWVGAWYGLGLAKSALLNANAREIRSPHQTAGTGWAQGAANAFLQAVVVDSTFLPAAVALAKLTPQLRAGTSVEEMDRRLEVAVAANGTDPLLWLLVAEAATRRGDDSGAIRAFERAQALPDAPGGTILLGLARAHFALGDRVRAFAEYYRGAALPDSATGAQYRLDVGLIADSVELMEYDGVAADRRPDWLREFWGGRERRSGRPAGTRLVEHERRYRYALVHYAEPLRQIRQYSWDVPYRSTPPGVDDRGAVYIRHGPPDQTSRYIAEDMPPNESWLYFRPEGNLIFHFAAATGGFAPVPGGWRLQTSIFAIPGALSHLSGILESRMGLDPRFGGLSLRVEADSILVASNIKLGRSPTELGWIGQRQEWFARTTERASLDGRAAIAHAMSTDSDPLRFDRELAPIVQVFGTGAPARGRGRLLVALSLPYDARLPSFPRPDGKVGYTTWLRVTAGDDSGRTTLDVDTLVRITAPRPLAAGEFLTIVRTFDLPATGDQRVRVILADSARTVGAVRVVNGVPVPDLGDTALTVSDLIVGRLGSGVEWSPPGGAPIALNPLNAWSRGSDLELAFEVGGLAPGATFHVRVAVGDITADTTRPPRSAAEFDLPANGIRTSVTHSLALQSLRPGRYLLTVTVTAGGRSIRRDRRLTIVGR